MSVKELNRSQLIQLKVDVLFKQFEEQGKTPSWGSIADADTLIPDEVVFWKDLQGFNSVKAISFKVDLKYLRLEWRGYYLLTL